MHDYVKATPLAIPCANTTTSRPIATSLLSQGRLRASNALAFGSTAGSATVCLGHSVGFSLSVLQLLVQQQDRLLQTTLTCQRCCSSSLHRILSSSPVAASGIRKHTSAQGPQHRSKSQHRRPPCKCTALRRCHIKRTHRWGHLESWRVAGVMAPVRRASPAALLCALLLLAYGGRSVATDSSSSDNGGDDSNDDDESSSDVAAEAPAPDGIAGSLPGTVFLGVRAFHTQLPAFDSQYFEWLRDFAGSCDRRPAAQPFWTFLDQASWLYKVR